MIVLFVLLFNLPTFAELNIDYTKLFFNENTSQNEQIKIVQILPDSSTATPPSF